MDFNKETECAKKLGIHYNQLSILDAKERLLAAARTVWLDDSDAVLKWLDGASDLIKAVTAAEAAAEGKTDADCRLKLARAYDDAGRFVDASREYGAVLKALSKDDKRVADILLRKAEMAMQSDDWDEAQRLYVEVFPRLLEAKDERAVNASHYAYSALFGDGKTKEARELMLKVANTFPKNEEAQYLRVTAAWYLAQDGDTKAAIAELEAIIAAGKKDDPLVQSAQSTLDSIKQQEKDKE